MAEFSWKVVDRAQTGALLRWQELRAQVHAHLPQAVTVTVTTQGGVQLHDAQGECLDLTALPLSLIEALSAFFSLGTFQLARPHVERPYQSR